MQLTPPGSQASIIFGTGAAGDQLGAGRTDARVSGADPEHKSYSSWAPFSDPDGNGWRLQELKTRLPGR